MSSPPVTWAQAAEQHREAAEYGLGLVDDEVADLLSLKPKISISPELGAMATLLIRAQCALGTERCAPAVAEVSRVLPRARGEFRKGVSRHDFVGALALVELLNIGECCGISASDAEGELAGWLGALLPHRQRLSEQEEQTLALALLAVGELDGAALLLGESPFVPGASFGPDVHGFAQHLLAAQRGAAPLAQVQPAWQSFLVAFPRKLAAGTARWADLLFAARAVHQRLGGLDASQVSAALHGELEVLRCP